MIVNPPSQPSDQPSASIFLDYGVDGEKCHDQEIRLCKRGMDFKSRWQFDLGAELAVALTYHDAHGVLQRANLHGTIVGCEKRCTGCFQVTLLFVDLPEPLLPVVEEISNRLKSRISDSVAEKE